MQINAKTIFNLIIGRETNKQNHGDPSREVFETVVFVVVLVLLLKLFVAEAFVIPTGSMASTLYGDQFIAECPECAHKFAVSATLTGQTRLMADKVECQNCGNLFSPKNASEWNSGDRVLVAKFDYHMRGPRRFEVPVFKYPVEPYSRSDMTAMNYIKRLVGLPGETIAIYQGDLYRTDKLKYETAPRPDNPNDLWQPEYMYANRRTGNFEANDEALGYFMAGKFEMIRKTPKEILAVRRLVFDLDLQPKSLTGKLKTRWHPAPGEEAGWEMLPSGFKHTGEQFGWVRYQHVQPGWPKDSVPEQGVLIRDSLSYNLDPHRRTPAEATSWVPDLNVECEAEFKDANAQVTLELTKSTDRFHAVFANGKCQLITFKHDGTEKPHVLAEIPTKITTGKHSLRFANFDSRMTIWVDEKPLDFGDAANYDPPSRSSFTHTPLDAEAPARIGAKGDVVCGKVRLFRDVFYTCAEGGNNDTCGVQTYYVQPGHYLCMGDNSTSSSDGRSWGLVPERLLLGRAAAIYWPLNRWRVIK